MNYLNLFYQLLPEAVLVISALALLGVSVASESKSGKVIQTRIPLTMALIGVILAALALYFGPKDVVSGTVLLSLDPLAMVMKAVVLGLGFLALLLTPARREMKNPGEFYALMLFAITGLTLTVGTNNLIFMFVALELASLSMYLLSGFSRTEKASEASLKYFMFGGVSAAFMLFGLSFLYGFAHAVTLEGVATAVVANPSAPFGMMGLLLVIIGLGFKMAAAPFHFWAPDVYQGSPVSSVALISAASKAVGMVVLIRFLLIGFPAAAGSASWGEMSGGWAIWIAVISAVSMIFGNLLAIAQKSVRRMLAYSAVANSGYLFVGLASAGVPAAGAALFYVIVYGLATFGAFAVTALVERDRGSDSQEAFAGLVYRSPLQAVALFIFMASLAGIPPLAGFAGKFVLFSSALANTLHGDQSGLTWLVGLGAVVSAISLYYYLKVLKQAFVRGNADDAAFNRLKTEEEGSTVDKSTLWAHTLAIAIPAVAIVLLGLFPGALLEPIQAAVKATLGM